MGPTNDHERAIARLDKISLERRLCPTSIEEVVAGLNFAMTRSDSEFLVSYIRWRMENPN